MHKYVVNKIAIFCLIACFTGASLISGCSSLRQPTLNQENHFLTWPERQQQLKDITQWNITGVMGITYADKTDIVNFNWQQNGDNYVINLHGPLGLGSAKIIGDENAVTLWKSETEKVTATSPEKLVKRQFGWELPVSYLQSWIFALPDSSSRATHLKLDNYNHLVQLDQDDWQIKYSLFKSTSNAIDLPTRIYLDSPNDLSIKLVIKSFNAD